MTLLLQAAPLLVLVGLLASGRGGPLLAAGAAIALALPAAWVSLPAGAVLPGFLADEAARAVWLAAQPIGIVLGGLLFHAATEPPASATADPDPLFTGAFLLGAFMESVTGFAVGVVFALGAIRAAGVTGAPAGALALFALTMVPWGGLGPGTALGAALAEVPVQDLAGRNAWLTAAWMLLILPVFWRICGIAGRPVPPARCLAQLGWIGALGALLVASHAVLPFEVAGILATGPLLALRLVVVGRPASRADWSRMLAAAWPYLALTAALLGSRLWAAPAWAPYPGLLPLPANHAMFVLWLVAGTLLALRGRAVLPALGRAWRPALVILLFVLLARIMAGSGASAALAAALAGAFGTAAPFAAPLLAAAAGFFGGTNVVSNAAMMPVQAELGRLAGLAPALLPAVQNFVGCTATPVSAQVTGLTCALLADGTRPAALWRLVWPLPVLGMLVGLLAVAFS